MTASIEWQGNKATLNDQGVWESNDAAIATYLNAVFSSKAVTPSPAAGVSMYARQARKAAAKLGAKVTFPVTEEVEGEQDRVY